MPTNLELSRLSPAEKLRLIESLWDDLSPDPSGVPVEDWQKEELDRREVEAAAKPVRGRAWDDVKADIVRRHVP